MRKAILYIHGQGGSYLEAEQYKKNCPGFDIFGIDYNDYLPWIVQDKIRLSYNKTHDNYDQIYLIANSIGAYFAMHTLQNCSIEKALFVSPILDMERLILDMMNKAKVTESDLKEKGEIPTSFGETLSWKYLCYVREHPIKWDTPTEILYAGRDHLVSRLTVNKFINNHNANLTVMEDGEHWFHTEEQIAFLDNWMKRKVINLKDMINNLCSEDNASAYQTLLELELICTESNELYPYFDEFLKMLKNTKTFVRVRGFRMICALAKWDTEKKNDNNIETILKELEDDKGTSVRQCLDKIKIILLYKPDLINIIESKLQNLDISKHKESMKSLIKKDIEYILKKL